VESSKLKELIDRALQDKILTRAEQQEILQAVTADSQVSPEEHELLEMIVERLNSGEIRERRDSRRRLIPFLVLPKSKWQLGSKQLSAQLQRAGIDWRSPGSI
jgi:hypothetical protein